MTDTVSTAAAPRARRPDLRLRLSPAALAAMLAEACDAGRGDALSHDAGTRQATPRARRAGGGDRG